MIADRPGLSGLSEAQQRELLARLLRERAGRPRTFPVSYAQQRLWLVCQLDPGTGAYNVPSAVRLSGVLHVAALAAGFAEIVRRHEALRTTFALREGLPVQIVSPSGNVELPVIDLAALPDPEAERRRLSHEAAAQPFDLVAGPLLRLRLLRLGAREHVLVVVLHHLICDGWSIGVLVREIATLYRSFVARHPSPLPALTIQYADFSKWQRDWLEKGAMERQLAYWRERLAHLPAALDLPADRPRPARQSFRGAFHPVEMPAELSRSLAGLGQREGASLFMVLLAGFYGLLWRYTGRFDLPVGSPIANRNRSQTEELIGLFVNTLVLRGRLVPEEGFQALLAAVRDLTLAAYAHQDLPFERLVEELRPERELSRTPLFQVMFVLQNAPMPTIELPGLTMTAFEVDRRAARFDLLLNLHETAQGIRGWLEYSTDLFAAPTMARMAHHLAALLAAAVADPERPLADLPLLAASERLQLLTEWNDTAAELPREICLHQLFESQADRTPEAVAVRGEEETLTYRELEERANRLAHHLRAAGVGPESVVGVLLERSVGMVVALFGALKAGGAYLPLDPAYPRERLAMILAEAAPPVVITVSALAGSLPAEAGATVLLDTDGPRIARRGATRPVSGVGPGHLAYVIYTSGSTGRPKGTMNAHRGIVNRVAWMQAAYGLDAGDAVLQKTPFGFDVSVWEFFWTLAVGARLVVARPEGHRDPAYLAEVIRREGITTLHFVPSLLRSFVQEPGSALCTGLRRVMASGEALPADLRTLFCERLPETELHNLYGPTEAAVDVTAWACRRAWDRSSVPIGRPISNLRVHLLDATGQLAPLGVSGELHIGGVGVGRGYLARPDLTAERFVPDPFAPLWGESGARLYRTGDLARHLPDGTVDFLGRIDHQVKIRGFRIELQEIEAALAAHPSVAEAAVAVHEESGGHRQLVAYVVGRGEVASAGLRSFLAERLPEPMVPAVFVSLSALPIGPTGKLDRRGLPAPERASGAGFVAPRTPLEELLASVWARVLRLERVGVNDNFFALGGDSIRSIQVRTGVTEKGWTFPLQEIFQHQTVAELARRLVLVAEGEPERTPAAPFSLLTADDRRLLPAGIEDAYPLAALQAGMLFHTQLAAGTAIYHDVFSYHLRAPFDAEALAASLRQSIARHPTLRTSFDLVHFSEPLQLVHREVELPLGVEDLRGLKEREQRAVIAAWVATEKKISFDWSRPPLLRFRVHRRGDETFQFSFSFHHTILDGWSLASVLTEVFQRYLALLGRQGAAAEEPPRLRYHDFVALERETLAAGTAETYWRSLLAGSSVAALPRWPAPADGEERDRERPVGVLEVPVAAAVSAGVQELARDLAVPVRSVLLAAHVRVVALLSGQEDLVTGLVSNGRPDGPGGEQVLGLFLNTLPFRIRLRGGSWSDLVRATFETEREIFPHRRYPMGVLQRRLGGEPLFETAFNFVHYHVYQGILEHGEIEALEVDIIEETNLPLMAYFNLNPATGAVHLVLKYDTARVAAAQAVAIGGYYSHALEAVTSGPDEAYASRPLLSAAELHQLLSEWNDAAAPGLAASPVDLLARHAGQRPQAAAVRCGEEVLTYAQLAERTGALAAHLIELGVVPGDLVALLTERGVDLLVSMLAVFAASAAYLPLDPEHPVLRNRELVERSGARLVLAAADRAAGLAEAFAERPAERRPQLAPIAVTLPPAPLVPAPSGVNDLAYVIYTSGSTGVPKGAMVEQGGMRNHLAAKIRDLALGPADVVAQTASQCFDISVWQLLAPLGTGGGVHIVPDEIAHDPVRLLDTVELREITVLETVPSMLRALLDEATRREEARPALARLRWLLATGEALPPDLCRRWLALYPRIPVWNAYGPTECSDDVTHHRLASPPEDGEANIPIGRPVGNTRLYVVAPGPALVPPGVAGELWIGGAGVGRGYLDDAGRTAEVFVPDLFGREAGERLYRTGDLVRQRPDGLLEFLGRTDHQVKVRGYRLELQEVEVVLSRHPAVHEAVALAVEGPDGDRRLAAYVVFADGVGDRPSAAELRTWLGDRLPPYMVPTAWMVLPALPLTANGKVDRRALPAPEAAAPVTNAPRIAPRTPVEELLVLAWAEVLRLDEARVSVTDDFFALGGHSLLATQLVSRVRAALGVDLPLRELFEAPTVAFLAERLEALRRSAATAPPPPIHPAPPGPVSLSFPQERLWFLDQLEPGGTAYNLPTVVRIGGALDPAVLALCFTEIVRRHEALRTVFVTVQGQPRQVVQAAVPPPLPLIDLTTLPAVTREETGRDLAREEIRRPFDLTTGPLLRTVLLRIADDRHLLVLTVHHAVSDGWSLGVLIQELAALYPAFADSRPSPLDELPLQYRDFAVWQREQLGGEALAGQLAFWREELAGAPPVLELHGRRPRQARLGGATRWMRFPPTLSRDLRALGRREGATLFMTLVAGFATLLHRYTGQEDLVLGTPVANRTRPELEGLIGFFVNTLVLRTDLSGSPTFRELLGRVRPAALDAYAHQDLPFERLVAELNPDRDLGRSPLFQAMLVFHNAPVQRLELPDLSFELLEIDSGSARFELMLTMIDQGDEIAGAVQWRTDLFEMPTILRLVDHLTTLFAAAVAEPGARLRDLSLLGPAERQQLAMEWNDRRADYPEDRAFPDLFAAQVARSPDAVAVLCGGESWSYRELDRRSDRLAHILAAAGVGPETLVALAAERGPLLLAAILAVWKAGGAYLPLDPRHPAERHRQILEQARPALLLYTRELEEPITEALAALSEPERARTLRLEEVAAAPVPEVPLPPRARPHDLAYVIFTSGSTGVPKGAMVVQRGMVNHLWAKVVDLGLTAADRVAQTASQCFDISVWQMLAPLAVGGRVVVYLDEIAHDPAGLLRQVERDGVSVLEIVPSLLRALLVLPAPGGRPGLAALRWMIATGEALPPDLCREWGSAWPRVPLLNAYGPTECSDDVTHHILPAGALGDDVHVPIGRPVANTRLYLLDPSLRPVPIGVTGQLWAAGDGVGRGYLGDPERTARAFLPDLLASLPGERMYGTGDLCRALPDGALEFLGRLDHQVKVRGFRIELGEIEAVLAGSPDLSEAVVVARPEAAGGYRLVACVVPAPGREVEVAALRKLVRQRLPEHMTPGSFLVLERLPLTANGKLDREVLAALDDTPAPAEEYVPPASEVEETLAEIFATVIGAPRVGVYDNFFDLGGHSLLATQVVSRVREAFEVELTLRGFFEAPTVAELAAVVESLIIEQIEALGDSDEPYPALEALA